MFEVFMIKKKIQQNLMFSNGYAYFHDKSPQRFTSSCFPESSEKQQAKTKIKDNF
jgi:hypothetical protein